MPSRQAAQHTWKCALKVIGDTTYKKNRNQTHQHFHFSCCFACPPVPSAIPGQHSKDLSVTPAKRWHGGNFLLGEKKKHNLPQTYFWGQHQRLNQAGWEVSPHSHKPSLASQDKGTQIWHSGGTMGMKGNTSHPQVKRLNNPHMGKETETLLSWERINSVIYKDVQRKNVVSFVSRGDSGKLCMESQGKTHIHCFSLTVFFSLWLLPALTNPEHFLYPQSWSSIFSCQPASVSSQLAPVPTHTAAISPTSPTSQCLRCSQPTPSQHTASQIGMQTVICYALPTSLKQEDPKLWSHSHFAIDIGGQSLCHSLLQQGWVALFFSQ